MRFRLPTASRATVNLANLQDAPMPPPTMKLKTKPRVYQSGNVLYDDIDLANLAPRETWREPTYHQRKQNIMPEVKGPNLDNDEETRTWLEQRFIGSYALGSPLLQFMTESRKWSRRADMPRCVSLATIPWRLSDGESKRFFSANDTTFIGKPRNYDEPPLYPEYGEPEDAMDDCEIVNEDEYLADYEQKARRTGLSWDDPNCSAQDLEEAEMWGGPEIEHKDAFRAWLERRYPSNDPHLGSPLFQYLMEFYAGSKASKEGEGWYLSTYLSKEETCRWITEGDFGQVWDHKPLYPDQSPKVNGASLRENIPVVKKTRKAKNQITPYQQQPMRKQKHKGQQRKKDQPGYVDRLRAGVSKRKHEKTELVCLEFKGRKAEQARLL